MVICARVAVESPEEPHRQRELPALAPAPELLLQLQRSAGNAAVARRLAHRSVDRMAIAHGGQNYDTSRMSDSDLAELLRGLPGPSLFQAARQSQGNQANVLIERLQSSGPRDGYVRALTVLRAHRFTARYLSGVPANLQAPVHLGNRIEQFVALGMPVEDYTSDVFARAEVAQKLTAISAAVAQNPLPGAAERVCDLLLFTSLVATEGGGAAARSMQVLTPAALGGALDPAKLAGVPQQPPQHGQGQQGAQPPDPRRRILQDMLRVNASTLDGALGGAVTSSALFTAILDSNVIDVVLLANSQLEEQDYMSTCSIAARDQEVLARIGSLAGLIVLGRLVAKRFLQDLAAQANVLTGKTSNQGENLYVHAREQGSRTLIELGEIEFAALTLVHGGQRDVDAYGGLVARWGKVMQRISSVLQVPTRGAQSGRESVAVLSDKIIPGQWLLSAFAMAVPVLAQASVSPDFVAHMTGRVRPPSAQAYSSALGQAGMTTTGGNMADLGQRSKNDWSTVIQRLWSETLYRGAMPFSIPGHAVVMKAVRSKGAQRFLFGDPKGSTFDEFTLDDMATYLSKQAIEMPFDPFS